MTTKRFAILLASLLLVLSAALLHAQSRITVRPGVGVVRPTVEPAPPAPEAAAPPVVKVPLPPADEIAKAAKLLNDVFKDDVAAAKTPDQKYALANKILSSAKDEKEPASQYAMFNRAREIAIEIPNIDLACTTLEKIGEAFDTDMVKLTADTISGVYKAGRNTDQLRKLSTEAATCADRAADADRYDISRAMIDIAIAAARASQDANLTKDILARAQKVKDLEAGYADAKRALATLADKPSDPDANLRAGKYYAIIKGDWDKGLPMLALGNDEPLKAAAKADMANPATPEAVTAVGDLWWDVAEKLTGAAQYHVRLRSGKLYELALPQVTGLSKTRLEKRVALVNTDKAKFAEAKIINLMTMAAADKMYSPPRWTIKDGAVTTNASYSVCMQFPYHPPEEYDFRVEFTRNEGTDAVVLNITGGEKGFCWVIAGARNSYTGFEYVGGKRFNNNPTSISGGIENGHRYEALLKVRKTGVEAYFNGKLIYTFKTDYTNVERSPYFSFPDPLAIGLGSYASPTTFHKAEITEISGPGTVVNPNAPRGIGN